MKNIRVDMATKTFNNVSSKLGNMMPNIIIWHYIRKNIISNIDINIKSRIRTNISFKTGSAETKLFILHRKPPSLKVVMCRFALHKFFLKKLFSNASNRTIY